MRLGLVLLLALSSFTALAQEVKKLVVNADPKATQFVISLPANPSTGFSWRVLQYDTQSFNLVERTYHSGNKHALGSGGKMNFVFAPKKSLQYPNCTKMTFQYARSWEEPQSGVLTAVTVSFKSSPKTIKSTD